MKVEEIEPATFIATLAKTLVEEKKIERPAEAEYIKTGHGKENAPQDPNWYHIRVASILRKLYMEELKSPEKLKHGFGTLWFAQVYSTAKNNGHKPSHTVTGSKSLVRRILQGLERVGFVSQIPKGGRRLTSTGRSYLEAVSAKC
ncbi:small subunit ribosomal protein S19e [Nematocida homosporus]|uniref:small subunit ribosomal protein S19e n=1 Tax=Nematocida homosporus TaxID=1912981 RepID=UPI0022200FD6|nr:small subunit ribosomal protein S19e [Nematocida homosporus]KAI5187033.1 small subunit ribosomal protein S19e [Nematocida homosporus]